MGGLEFGLCANLGKSLLLLIRDSSPAFWFDYFCDFVEMADVEQDCGFEVAFLVNLATWQLFKFASYKPAVAVRSKDFAAMRIDVAVLALDAPHPQFFRFPAGSMREIAFIEAYPVFASEALLEVDGFG